MQGEDRDSSDEEWANAYATMDPISQLGWRNRRGANEGPAEQLLRDVFEAADVVHSNAMSEVGGSRHSTGSDFPLGGLGVGGGPNDGAEQSTQQPRIERGGRPGRFAVCCTNAHVFDLWLLPLL